MNAYWLTALVFMVIIGTACALTIKHYKPLRDVEEVGLVWFCSAILTVFGGVMWPLVLLATCILSMIWVLYSVANKFINKRKGK